MANLFEGIKISAMLKATAMVLEKVDSERIAGYLEYYGEKTYKRGKKDFIEMSYLKLLELVSAVNRLRRRC